MHLNDNRDLNYIYMPILFFSLLVALCLNVIQAAELRFSHLGLEQGGVNVLTQDKHGFIWLGTDSGLVRYDGHSVTSFRHEPDDITSIQADEIIALHKSQSGYLWIGTAEAGASYFDDMSGKFIRIDSEVIGSRVYHFHETESGQGIYAQTSQGLFLIGQNKTAQLVLSMKYSESVLGLSFSDSRIHAILETGEKLTISNNPNKPDVSAILQKKLIQLWKTSFCPELLRESIAAGGGSGLFYCLKDKRVIDSRINEVLFLNGITPSQLQVFDLKEDSNGVIWISSNMGLLRISGNKLQVIKSAGFDGRGLSGNTLSALFIGENNTLFVGTQSQGLNILNQPELGIRYFNSLSTAKSKPCEAYGKPKLPSVWTSFEDQSKGLWLGNNIGLAYHGVDPIQQQASRAINSQEGDSRLCNIQALEVVNSELWVGTHKGLFKYDKQNRRLSEFHSQNVNKNQAYDSLADRFISALKYDSQRNVLWVGTYEGVVRLDLQKKEITQYFADASILSIHLDERNRLWLGTHKGLFLWSEKSNTFKNFQASDDSATLSDPSVYTIHQSEAQKLWLGTGNGLNLFDSKRFVVEKRWFERDGLPSPVIYRLQTDEYGFYWLSTGNGISRFDPKSNRFRNFYPQHDTQSAATDSQVLVSNKKKLIYLTDVGGLSVIDPQAFVKNDEQFPPVIAKVDLSNPDRGLTTLASILPVSVFGEQKSLGRDVRLNYTFPFFGDGSLIRSQSRLLPVNDDWSENLSASGFVDFKNLEPGRYEFQVRNSHSGARITSHRFVVEPYLWETIWFKALVWFFALLLSALIFKQMYQLLRKFSAERGSRQHYRIVEHELRPHLHEANRHLEALMDSPDITSSDKQRIRSSVMPLVGKSIDFIAELRSLVDFKGEMEQPRKLYMLEDVLDEALLFFKDQQQRIIIHEVDDMNILTHKDAVYLLVKNLISNAIKYSPGGEPVELKVRSVGDALIVECLDQGIGISKENRQAIYEPYKRLTDEYKNIDGQGIGLAIVRYIVHTYQGEITVTDNSPKGSCFTVKLRGVVVNDQE